MKQDLCALLRGNSYPGRGILLGRSADGKKAVIAYFIMGRSENMDPQAVEPLPAEGGDEGGMDVDDGPAEAADEVCREDAQKARQHRHVDAVLPESGEDPLLKARLFPHDGHAGDAGLLRPGDGPDPGPVGHHQGDGAALERPPALCAKIEKAALDIPPIFRMLQRLGNIPERDMFNTFKCLRGAWSSDPGPSLYPRCPRRSPPGRSRPGP